MENIVVFQENSCRNDISLLFGSYGINMAILIL